MGFYDDKILPHVINLACGTKPIAKQRDKVVPDATGRVLEVGVGSGLNMPFYNKGRVERIWGLEPSLKARDMAAPRISASGLDVDFIGLDGQQIPLDNNVVDTVVLTFTLCTIPNAQLAVKEMKRVLKPDGRLLFCEHGKAPDPAVQRWQDRLNPVWKKIGGGCHLNRDIPALIRAGGFQMDRCDTMYVPGPKFASYMYWGVAK